MPALDAPHEADGPLPASGVVAARRSRPIYRVFVSSTWLDLQPERRALMEALNRMEEMRFVGMEFFGNRPDDTHDASIDQVDLCEVFVGLIGHRYGSGITAAEYRRARALSLPCFVYFKRAEAAGAEQTDNDPALAAQLEAFKAELLREHTVKEFVRPDELAANATADLHNWVAARWISLEREQTAARPRNPVADADRTNALRLIERVDQDWVKGVLEASLHHRAWLELGLDWREDAVEHPWDRIVVAPDRPIQTLDRQDSITGVFDAAQHTLLVLGEPGAGKTTTVLELARDLIARTRESDQAPAPVVLALSTWRGQQRNLEDWLITELGLRYQVPKRVARTWLEEGRLVLILDGLDEVVPERRAACVAALNAFQEAHPPAGLVVTCRVAEYDALTAKLRLRSAICLQPLTAEQIDRYFKAAGTGLDPLRAALRADAGLRELARSPLMLSVMTMAWRDAPAGTTAPFAAAQTPEELRRRLFDAYVQAALKRRGKASSLYAPEPTIRWLTWLAQRMKEHGHTLFALEQLQPDWLEGTWRQFGYFIASRFLGTAGLALPFLFARKTSLTSGRALVMLGLALLAGCYLGTLDFALARHGWGGTRRAMLRYWLSVVGLALLLFAWMALGPGGDLAGTGLLYFLMVGLAFCAPVDVRALDIKPAGSIQWSRRLAAGRALAGAGIVVAISTTVVLVAAQAAAAGHGWAQGWIVLGGWSYLTGLAVGIGLVVAGRRLRRGDMPQSTVLTALGVLLCGEIGGGIGAVINGDSGSFWNLAVIFASMFPALAFGAFGGFGSTLIDPARPQQAGFWFWLRVPVLAFLTVGGIIYLPGLVLMTVVSIASPGEEALAGFTFLTLFCAGCGLVAFLRFGGFNGAQHFLLRWLLARGGHLPPRPEAFLNHAAQLALLQKVGLGYRFVHALLLQHLASPPGTTAEPAPAEAVAGGPDGKPARPWARGERVLRVAAQAGLGAGLLLVVWLGVAGLALGAARDAARPADALANFVGALMLSIALAMPILLLTGRWLGARGWRWLGAGWLALGLTLAYLVIDEPAAIRPPSLAEAPTAFPEAEKSNAVLGRYDLTQYGQPRAFRWTGFNFTLDPERRETWPEFLHHRRSEIGSNWQKLEPVRAWVAELNSFERIADLHRDLLDFTMIDYQVSRPLIQNSMACASLQALDGQGDAALATLLPLLEVGGKLEEGARGFFYLRDAREMQDGAIRAAGFVLDHSRVSPESRARFAVALVARGGGMAGARRGYAVRHAAMEQAASSFGRAMTAWEPSMFDLLKPEMDLLGPVAFNRQAALNRWGELFADLGELAARHETGKAEQRAADFLAREGSRRFKNVGNSWAVCLMNGPLRLKRIAEDQKQYWTVEDRRTALVARLQAP